MDMNKNSAMVSDSFKDKNLIRRKLARKRAQVFEADQLNGARAGKSMMAMGEKYLQNFQKNLLLSSRVISGTTIVAGYIPIGSEIDPRPLMSEFSKAGAVLCLPEVVAKGKPLRFRQWAPGDMLISGAMGTLQPLDSARILEPDILLMPLVGLDSRGVRLGQGGGFYDRTLAVLRDQGALAFGVGFDEQLVELLPCEDHDQQLDGVFTPSFCKIWDFGRQTVYLAQA